MSVTAGRRRGLPAAILAMTACGWPAASGAAPSFAAVAPRRAPAEAAVTVFDYQRFGAVHLYRGRGHPHDVVLFVSGESGWDAGAASLARQIADKGAVVAGIDLHHYREELETAAEGCVSPDSEFENLSHYLQSTLGLKNYLEPMLVGAAAGAAWVYAILAEAPEGLFKSALSIGFCPTLDLKKAVCGSPNLGTTPRLDSKGVQQGVNFSPPQELSGKWVTLQGQLDTVCPARDIQKFAARVPGAETVILPHVAHDYSSDEKWRGEYEAAVARLSAVHPEVKAATLPVVLADLPLVIVPAPAGSSGDWFGVFLTGDGGWVGLDKGVAAELAKHNIPIIGWDSLKYFWSRRTPEGAARDLDRVLRHFSHAWGRSHALLIGYSQGADTIPFMVNRLPPASHQLVGFTTLLGISDNAVFEVHVSNWLGNAAKGVPTGPELEHWSGSPYLCLYGESDADSACAELTGHDGSAVKMPGGHHFGGVYSQIAAEILQRLPRLPQP